MNQDLLNSIDFDSSDLEALDYSELKPRTYYVLRTFNPEAVKIVVTRDLLHPESKTSMTIKYYYPLLHVTDYVFNNLEENQPTFDHKYCGNCEEWVLKEEVINHDEHGETYTTSICKECRCGI